MNETNLIEYSREVMPLVRALQKKKELIKDCKDSDENVTTLQENVKCLQKKLDEILADNDDYNQLVSEMKEVSVELKQAIKSASRASGFKAQELKEYFFARAKQEAVEKTVKKAERFQAFEKLIDQNA
jgi:Mg2+ and Co2+ transporter CorA